MIPPKSEFFLVIVAACFQIIDGQRFYQIVGSRSLRPFSDYQSAISIHGTTSPVFVSASLQGFSRTGLVYSKEDSGVILPYSTHLLQFKLDDLQSGNYTFRVRGRGGVDFESTFPLEFINKSCSVFIQPDRNAYNPGSTVQFRVIVVDSDLKPLDSSQLKDLTVKITNTNGDVIKQWEKAETTLGIFTGKFTLAPKANYGKWHIHVSLLHENYEKSFDVVEYVLPKFELTIDVPKDVTFKDKQIVATFDARSDVGEPIKGEAIVLVQPIIFSDVIQPIYENPFQKVFDINGKKSVTFDIKTDLKLKDEFERRVTFYVAVEEAGTGLRQNISKTIYLHKHNMQIDLLKISDYFKPGLNYLAYVKVIDHEGNPPKNSGEITVKYKFSPSEFLNTEHQYKLDNRGVAKIQHLMSSNVSKLEVLDIEVQYQDISRHFSPILAAQSFSRTFLQVSLIGEKPTVNKDAEILVESTESMKYVNCILFAKGNVLKADTIQIPSKKSHTLRIFVTNAMAPILHLVVTYVRDDGELVGDALDIEIDGYLENFVTIETNSGQSDPSAEVEISIKTQSNSYVGLLAVDSNAENLNLVDKLSTSNILSDLEKYETASPFPHSFITANNKFYYAAKPEGDGIYDSILNSGAILFTNSRVPSSNSTSSANLVNPIFYQTSTRGPRSEFNFPLETQTRPPLAGPFAFSRIPKPVWDVPKVYLTEPLQKTWIFANLIAGPNGTTSIRRKLPESLNRWTLSAFSLNRIHGLGFSEVDSDILVSKSLKIEFDLPYSVQRGEALSIQIVIHHNMNEGANCEVTLHNPDQKFYFASSFNSKNATKRYDLYKTQKITLGKRSISTTTFTIVLMKEGSIPLKITASTPRYQDSITKNLLVDYGGKPEYHVKSILIDLRQQNSYEGSLNYSFPPNILADSDMVETGVAGDFFSSAVRNFKQLVRVPKDCGEQNLLDISATITLLNHLESIKQDDIIKINAINLLEAAYQSQLSYKTKNGSFSVFPNREGSVWVTAYTLSNFKKAEKYIFVDQNILKDALSWLSKTQRISGGFFETGPAVYLDAQNKNGKSLALTSFVLLSLKDMDRFSYQNSIDRGLDYLARNIDENESVYALALASYALHFYRHPSKNSAFNLLNRRALTKNDLKWWSDTDDINATSFSSIDIETTAYALLTIIERDLVEDSIPIVKWLLNQQSNLGGFKSTQDTAVALYALFKTAEKMPLNPNMQIKLNCEEENVRNVNVNVNNALIEQKSELQNCKEKRLNITARGSGLAIAKIYYQYNTDVTGALPSFIVDPQVDKISNKNHIQISVCVGFIRDNKTDTSNMAVMEIDLPSGYITDVDSLASLEVSKNIEKFSTRFDESQIILYFNNITRYGENCITVAGFRAFKIANQKSACVRLYDYYNTSRTATYYYKAFKDTLCDICGDKDCGEACVVESKPLIANGQKNNSSQISALFILTLFSIYLSNL